VFIGRGGQTKAKEAIRAAQRVINKSTDSVIAVVVPDDYARRMLILGQAMGEPERAANPVMVV